MAHAREPITTILSLVAVAAACFVVAKATWPVLLASFVVVSFGLCLYKLVEKELHASASKSQKDRATSAPAPSGFVRAVRS
jgi:hypothetical protein